MMVGYMVNGIWQNSGVEAFWPKAIRKVLPLLDREPFGVSLYVKQKKKTPAYQHHQQHGAVGGVFSYIPGAMLPVWIYNVTGC